MTSNCSSLRQRRNKKKRPPDYYQRCNGEAATDQLGEIALRERSSRLPDCFLVAAPAFDDDATLLSIYFTGGDPSATDGDDVKAVRGAKPTKERFVPLFFHLFFLCNRLSFYPFFFCLSFICFCFSLYVFFRYVLDFPLLLSFLQSVSPSLRLLLLSFVRPSFFVFSFSLSLCDA